MLFNPITKSAPVFNAEALWPDAKDELFYAYDGGYSYSVQISSEPDPVNQLWQFEPSGNTGSWSMVEPSPTTNFSLLSRAQAGLYASGNGLGFALGGSQSAATEFSWNAGGTDIPGMIVYNTSSQDWSNISTTGYSWSGTAAAGAAQFVPTFGPAGLLLVFGGTANGDLVPFTNVSMYEPVSQQWRSQEVSGTLPSPVTNPCVVGVPGDNETYEVSLRYASRSLTDY